MLTIPRITLALLVEVTLILLRSLLVLLTIPRITLSLILRGLVLLTTVVALRGLSRVEVVGSVERITGHKIFSLSKMLKWFTWRDYCCPSDMRRSKAILV